MLGATEDVGVDDVRTVLHRRDPRPTGPSKHIRSDRVERRDIVPGIPTDGQALPGQFDHDLRVGDEDRLRVDDGILGGPGGEGVCPAGDLRLLIISRTGRNGRVVKPVLEVDPGTLAVRDARSAIPDPVHRRLVECRKLFAALFLADDRGDCPDLVRVGGGLEAVEPEDTDAGAARLEPVLDVVAGCGADRRVEEDGVRPEDEDPLHVGGPDRSDVPHLPAFGEEGVLRVAVLIDGDDLLHIEPKRAQRLEGLAGKDHHPAQGT